MNGADDLRPRADQDPAPDSEVDFDDERDPEISEPDEVENREIGAELDDPETIDDPDDR